MSNNSSVNKVEFLSLFKSVRNKKTGGEEANPHAGFLNINLAS